MIGQPGYMGPPPVGPIDDSLGSTPKTFQTDSGGGNPIGHTFNFTFNPGGGIGTSSMPGGGPGWMPPPPIQDPFGTGGTPRPPGGPVRLPPGRMPYPPPTAGIDPIFPPRGFVMPGTPQSQSPMRLPPGRMPGWAGYLNWLQMGGRMPPPPIGGI